MFTQVVYHNWKWYKCSFRITSCRASQNPRKSRPTSGVNARSAFCDNFVNVLRVCVCECVWSRAVKWYHKTVWMCISFISKVECWHCDFRNNDDSDNTCTHRTNIIYTLPHRNSKLPFYISWMAWICLCQILSSSSPSASYCLLCFLEMIPVKCFSFAQAIFTLRRIFRKEKQTEMKRRASYRSLALSLSLCLWFLLLVLLLLAFKVFTFDGDAMLKCHANLEFAEEKWKNNIFTRESRQWRRCY